MARRKKAAPRRGFLGLWLATIAVVSFSIGVGAAMREATAPVATSHPLPPPRARLQPPPVSLERGRLAIVIDDCGNNYAANSGFLGLGLPITVAVLPHLPATDQVAKEAHRRGLGVLLHLPMEALDGRNPGPGTLQVAMSDAELRQEIQADFAAVPSIEGVNNHEGSRASADPRVMGLVLDEVASRGLFYLDSRTTDRTEAPQLAAARQVTCLSRQVFLDNRDERQAVLDQLHVAQQRALTAGEAIAIGHPRSNTLAALQAYAREPDHPGVRLVALSVLAGLKRERPNSGGHLK